MEGLVGFFGANSAVEAARIIESMGKEKKREGSTEALRALEREIALVSIALEDYGKGCCVWVVSRCQASGWLGRA
jgi:hypothetical protein